MADENDDSREPGNAERAELVSRIDELERLLAEKKAEANRTGQLHMKVGTDGIPVLEDLFEADKSDSMLDPDQVESLARDNEVVEDIINKVDKEISQDLDELIAILKSSIIDEVKTRLMKELSHSKNPDADK
ncbi:MAG: hypothetical protein RIB78_03155 [Gammaproteobacteria bacterium]